MLVVAAKQHHCYHSKVAGQLLRLLILQQLRLAVCLSNEHLRIQQHQPDLHTFVATMDACDRGGQWELALDPSSETTGKRRWKHGVSGVSLFHVLSGGCLQSILASVESSGSILMSDLAALRASLTTVNSSCIRDLTPQKNHSPKMGSVNLR